MYPNRRRSTGCPWGGQEKRTILRQRMRDESLRAQLHIRREDDDVPDRNSRKQTQNFGNERERMRGMWKVLFEGAPM
jgi:hypothetical protein